MKKKKTERTNERWTKRISWRLKGKEWRDEKKKKKIDERQKGFLKIVPVQLCFSFWFSLSVQLVIYLSMYPSYWSVMFPSISSFLSLVSFFTLISLHMCLSCLHMCIIILFLVLFLYLIPFCSNFPFFVLLFLYFPKVVVHKVKKPSDATDFPFFSTIQFLYGYLILCLYNSI